MCGQPYSLASKDIVCVDSLIHCGQPYSLASKDIVYVDGLIH